MEVVGNLDLFYIQKRRNIAVRLKTEFLKNFENQ